MPLLCIFFNFVGLKKCAGTKVNCFLLKAKLLVIDEKLLREGIPFFIERREPSVVGIESGLVSELPSNAWSACKLCPDLLLWSSMLLLFTRCHGGAPLGENLTFVDGMRYFRSSNSTMTSRKITLPMPIKVAIMTNKSEELPFC